MSEEKKEKHTVEGFAPTSDRERWLLAKCVELQSRVNSAAVLLTHALLDMKDERDKARHQCDAMTTRFLNEEAQWERRAEEAGQDMAIRIVARIKESADNTGSENSKMWAELIRKEFVTPKMSEQQRSCTHEKVIETQPPTCADCGILMLEAKQP